MKRSEEVAIHVMSVSKSFRLPHQNVNSVKGAFLNIFRGRKTIERQKVLKGISLDIKKGEFFGIIGRNGNGKSTLLKLLAGIYSPDQGQIRINGKLTPFIELGVGFNPELTGRENVYLNGALLGFSRKEMDEMYEEIVGFAELERFMDQKLKNYSSGMQVRLAFSVAIRSNSDILLIDEVLAVGDSNFQKKCLDVFEDLKNEGRTVVFVSHAMGYIRDFCDRVAVIDKGKLAFLGDTEEAVDVYNQLNSRDTTAQLESENAGLSDGVKRLGNGKARVINYSFKNERGDTTIRLQAGKKFGVELSLEYYDSVDNPAIGIMFRKHASENLFGINNIYNNQIFGKQLAGQTMKIKAEGVMPLAPGTYYVSFTIADAKSTSDYEELDNLNNIMKINVEGDKFWGLVASKIDMETM